MADVTKRTSSLLFYLIPETQTLFLLFIVISYIV
uniref:Uncharacterized protein n=1 Tax=Arundo donax TaxID=35708 RepID=A0A0A9BYT0_ARUDO